MAGGVHRDKNKEKREEGRWQGRYSLTAPTHTPGRRIVREHVCVMRGREVRVLQGERSGAVFQLQRNRKEGEFD